MYNITVFTASNTKSTEGKLWVRLEAMSSVHEVQLTPHSTPLKWGSYYSYMADVPHQVETITGLLIKYKKRNILHKSSLGIQRVTLDPVYMGPNRFMNNKRFCPNGASVDVKNEVWFRLPVRC